MILKSPGGALVHSHKVASETADAIRRNKRNQLGSKTRPWMCLTLLALALLLVTAARAELPQSRFDRLSPWEPVPAARWPWRSRVRHRRGRVPVLRPSGAFSQTPPGPEVRNHRRRRCSPGNVRRLSGRQVRREQSAAVRRLARIDRSGRGGQEQLAGRGPAGPLNAAVNATADGNAEDFFRLTAKKGQRITIDCQAQRLDSDMDATLVLSTADGQPLVSNRDYYGSDPFLDFVAPADGDYLISVYDLSYRGGYPYRLIVSDRPQVENVFPAAVKAGQPATLTVFGRNLVGGQPSPWLQNDLPLAQAVLTVTSPAEVSALAAYRFWEHPTHHSVLPTAATCTLTGFQVQPEGSVCPFSAQSVMVTPYDVSVEVEPNDTQEQPQAITLPAVVCGRFDRPRDADWYALKVPENGSFAVDVYSERIAGRADPYVTILDDKGNRVSELDDFGHRSNAFDGAIRDPSGMVNLNKDVNYRLLVQDRYQRGGARYQYVLSVRPPVPDFYAAVIHSSNQNPAGTTIWKGAAATLDIVIHQWEGYNGPVTITAEDLPPGVYAAPVTITNNTRGRFVLWADDNAADRASRPSGWWRPARGEKRLSAAKSALTAGCGTTRARAGRSVRRCWPCGDRLPMRWRSNRPR